MESLAAIFVSFIIAINSVAPQTHISQKLGVYPLSRSNTAESFVLSDEDISTEADATSELTATPSSSTETRVEKVREQRKTVIDAAKTRRQEALSKAQTRREEFQAKVATLRDEAKKRIVTHLDEVMAKQNEHWLEKWNNTLTKLSEIVARIEARGADVTEANAAIAEAQAAVTAQGTQVYTISITTEANLRSDVSPVAQDFKADLRATQAKVKAAREAVHAAFKTIQKEEEPTTEGGENEAE